MILAYGWGVIGSTILILSFARMLWGAWRKSPWGELWNDSYFWLLLGVTVALLATAEIMTVRIWQTLNGGAQYAQPAAFAIMAGLTAITSVFLKMRALAINRPDRGRVFMWLCGGWAAVTAGLLATGVI
jgi:hypothetical protein